MRRLALAISILLGAACTPGSGEYGSCITTADCQIELFCLPTAGVITNDAGNPQAADGGGVCRRQCDVGTGSADCLNGEVCGSTIAYCSKDGGY